MNTEFVFLKLFTALFKADLKETKAVILLFNILKLFL